MLLKDWLERESKTQEWLGEQLGVSQEQVSRLCTGKSNGSAEVLAKIFTLTAGEVTPADMVKAAA